jgi:ABC-type antimicrobial peptide transport system permease subunit
MRLCHQDVKWFVVIVVALFILPQLLRNTAASGDEVHPLFPLDLEAMRGTIDIISSFGSRMTGYEGYEKTLNFIHSYLKDEVGLSPVSHTYSVLVPWEEEVFVEALEPFHLKVKAFAVNPNSINPSPTPSQGLVGRLVYVGNGDLKNYEGKSINGSIVAIDFNSGYRWLTAANLGAQAVVFIEPKTTTYYECDSKYLETSIGFTRVYLKSSDWEVLKNATKVRLVSRVSWKEVNATNLMVEIKGTVSPNEVVILSTHFDSWSVVPSLANSKTELIPLVLLLQYARYLARNPPRYTVWLAFYSGHWQALAGSREFIEDYFFSDEVQSGRTRILGNINFDMMASDSDGLQLLQSSYYTTYGGNAMHGGGFPGRLSWFMSAVERLLSNESAAAFIRERLRVANPLSIVNTYFSTTGFWGTEPIPYMLDSEPASISGIPAFSVTTRRSSRMYVGSPIGDDAYADVTKLDPYLQLVLYMADGLVRTGWSVDANLKPVRYELSSVRGYPGFASFSGRVVIYNFTTGWYDPVPNALVEAALVTSTYKLNKIFMRTDDKGGFVVHGVPSSGAAGGGGTAVPFSRWVFRGWVLNDEGTILMATDLGQFGMQNFPQVVIVLHSSENVTVAVSKAVSLEIMDMETPNTLTTPSLIDPRTSYFDLWRSRVSALMVYDMNTRSIPISYGFYYNGWEPVALVWVQPNLRFIVVGYTGFATGAGARPFLLLTNSTERNTEGSGYLLEYGHRLRLNFSSFETTKNMYYVSHGRYAEFSNRHVGSPSADVTLQKSDEYIRKTIDSLKGGLYSDAYGYALVARAYAYKAYDVEVMPLVNDAARSILFMFITIILGGFFLEKLVVHSQGPRRLAVIGLICAIFLAIFNVIHPAFGIMSNISLGMLGSLVMIILLIILAILLSEGEEVRKGIETRVLGLHRSGVSRMDTVMTAFSLGNEYIRRTRLRAIIMFITMIVMASAITSFTSLMPARASLLVSKPGYVTSLDEILVKNGRGVPPEVLSEKIVNVLGTFAGDDYYVLPRAWSYGPVDRGLQAAVFVLRTDRGANTTIPAVIGITTQEFELFYRNLTIGPGIFLENADHCMLSSSLASRLNLTLGDAIYVAGRRFLITGIVGSPETPGVLEGILDSMVEADGYNPLPANPQFFSTISKDFTVSGQAGASPPNLSVSSVLILPYERVLEIGGYVASVALIPKRPGVDMRSLAKELAYALDITIYVSESGAAKQLSTFTTVMVGGWELVLTILVIGALNITTMVLGSLKERTREIFVFSAVGLSPMGISVFFISEVLVYVIVGTLLGYVAGYLMTWLMIIMGTLPPTHVFNFASTFTVVGLLTIIIASLAAVSYPTLLASRIITPSLERRWKLKTKPKGDEWDIALPTSATSLEETRGILAYLYEYYTGAGAVREGVYVTREVARPDYENLILDLVMSLVPLEMGVRQRVRVASVLDRRVNRYAITVHLNRLSGPQNVWETSNYGFIDDLRKQLLMWGSLPDEEKQKYTSIAARG